MSDKLTNDEGHAERDADLSKWKREAREWSGREGGSRRDEMVAQLLDEREGAQDHAEDERLRSTRAAESSDEGRLFMSDNAPTKDIGAKYDTKPTIETVLECMSAMEERLGGRLDRIETLLDRVASVTFETRADLRDLKKELREHSPFVK